MKNFTDLIMNTKLGELISASQPEVIVEEPKCKNKALKIFAVVGVIAAVACAAFAILKYFKPDYLEDYEDDFEDYDEDGFEDDFDDDFDEE